MKYILIVFSLMTLAAYGDSVLSPSEQTQNLLKDPNARNQVIQKDTKAATANQSLNQAVGNNPQRLDEAYEISANIFNILEKRSGGDAKKLQKMVQELQENPEKIKAYLSDADREQIRKIASETEKK